jgi:hypothetical protein
MNNKVVEKFELPQTFSSHKNPLVGCISAVPYTLTKWDSSRVYDAALIHPTWSYEQQGGEI